MCKPHYSVCGFNYVCMENIKDQEMIILYAYFLLTLTATVTRNISLFCPTYFHVIVTKMPCVCN